MIIILNSLSGHSYTAISFGLVSGVLICFFKQAMFFCLFVYSCFLLGLQHLKTQLLVFVVWFPQGGLSPISPAGESGDLSSLFWGCNLFGHMSSPNEEVYQISLRSPLCICNTLQFLQHCRKLRYSSSTQCLSVVLQTGASHLHCLLLSMTLQPDVPLLLVLRLRQDRNKSLGSTTKTQNIGYTFHFIPSQERIQELEVSLIIKFP